MTGPVFNAGAIQATASVDKSEFIRDLRQLQTEIVKFQRSNEIKLNATIDRARIRADLRALKEELKGTSALKLDLSVNTAQAKRDIAEFRAYVRGLSAVTMKIDLNTGEARRTLAAYRKELRDSVTKIKIGASTTEARREVAALKRQLGNINIRVDANTLRALMQLRQVQNSVNNLNGQNAHINVAIGSDAGRVIGIIGLIVAGVSSIAYLAPAATAGLAGLFAVAGTGVQTIGALAFGLSGVSSAYKALGQESKKSSLQEGVSHSGVQSSLRSLENARRSESHTAETAAHTIAMSNRSVEDSQRSLTRAQEDAREAQDALNDARQEEINDLEDLRLRLRDTAISEKEAALNLREAQRHLELTKRDPRSTTDDIEKATLAVERAQLSVDETNKSYRDTQDEAAKAAKVGIEGSDKVVAAQKRVRDTNEQVADAERDLIRTRDDAAYAQKEALYSQVEAARAVQDAMAAVGEAQASAANIGVKSANQVEFAMSKLTPEGQRFVRFLYDSVRPALNSISDSTATAMLPKMQTGLERLLALQPDLQAGFAESGDIIGKLTIAGANMATTGPFRRDFATIMHGNNMMLQDFGGAGLFTIDALRSLYVVSLPLVRQFSEWVLTSAKLFDEWVQGKRATGELAQYMQKASDRAKELWNFFVNLIKTAYELGVALAPVGEVVLAVANGFMEFLQWLSKTNPEIVAFLGYAVLAFAAFTNIGKAILGLGSATRLGIAGFERLVTLIENMIVGSGNLITKYTGLSTVGSAVANTGTKVSNALNRVGAALPIVGAAVVALGLIYDNLVVSAEDAANAILQGGVAAETAAKQIETQTTVNDVLKSKWVAAIPIAGTWASMLADYVSPGAQQAADATEALKNAMTPLQRAQQEVTKATNDHALALERYGPHSAQTALAAAVLAEKTANLANEHKKASDAAQTLIDKMVQERDIMLGTIDAEIQYQDALARSTESIKQNRTSIDVHTEAGRNNLRALNDLARAATSHLEQLREQGATNEEVAGKEKEYRDQLYNTATQMGMSKEAADDYINKLHLVPSDVTTNFWANTQAAWDQINRFILDTKNAIATFQDGNVTVKFWADTGNILDQAQGRAMGGPIIGRGTETSDDIFIKASNNEHMWTAREVRAAGGHSAVESMRKNVLKGYAEGGPITIDKSVMTNFQTTGIDIAQGNYAKAITDYVKSVYSSQPGVGTGVEKWRDVGMHALSIAGQSVANVNRLLMQMNTESGGNQFAVNRWDSNWTKGTPSVGLMQVIGPTYAHYKHPNFNLPPFEYGVSENPISNILASIRYTLSRYGSLVAGWQGHGYDMGGIWKANTIGWNTSGSPERVLSPEQTKTFENFVNNWLPSIPPQFTGSSHSTTSSSTNTSYGNGIGTLIMQVPYGASPKEYVEHLDYALEYRRKKGVYR